MRYVFEALNSSLNSFEPSQELIAPTSCGQYSAEDKSSWDFHLPDPVSTLCLCPSEKNNFIASTRMLSRAQFWSSTGEEKPELICLDKTAFYLKASLELKSKESLGIWLRISGANAANIFSKKNPLSCWGLVSNLFAANGKKIGLFSMARIIFSPSSKEPLKIVEVNDEFTQYPGLRNTSAHALDSSESANLESIVSLNQNPFPEGFDEFMQAFDKSEGSKCDELATKHSFDWRSSARAQFELGNFLTSSKRHSQAFAAFHQAQLLAHPNALEAEWDSQSRISKTFRERYKEAFEEIEKGERFRALTQIRQAAQEDPQIGNAVLALCLRGAGVPEEGLKACETSLSLQQDQSDVLNHKWSYLTEMMRDLEALGCALDHLNRYPLDNSATANVIDSLLIIQKPERSILLAERYDILAPHPDVSLKYFFKSYEALQLWGDLEHVFTRYIDFHKNPSTETLLFYAETLVEVGKFEDAQATFEHALTIEPGNGKVVLGLARCLARFDREQEAEDLLISVLQDKNRIDDKADRTFLVTLLAEIQRRTGRPESAIETFSREINTDIIQLSESVGPLPALEYIESLYETGRLEEAKKSITSLDELWPKDVFVNELKELICNNPNG